MMPRLTCGAYVSNAAEQRGTELPKASCMDVVGMIGSRLQRQLKGGDDGCGRRDGKLAKTTSDTE